MAAPPTQAISPPANKTITIRIPKNESSNSGHTSYVVELLRLALEHSKQSNESILLQPITEDYTQARLIAELYEGSNIDVIWTMTSKDREATIKPIRVPILKGLLGQRVFLIRESQQYIFENVLTLKDLARLVAGQGSHWPDTDILRANGLIVFTSPHYELLFNMLKGGRFNYFPRGVNEAWAEIEAHPNEGLAVEKYLLLSYPAPMYFFVHQDNLDLANRIERGLEGMINDGSFDKLFLNHPSIINVVKRTQLDKRRIFKLLNPDLPKETPLGDPRYWLQLQ
ncbi:diguanylate cyclase [Simiduia curdlanivorans]|uniref:Substrate-binding periplasmic protein n=1 Tax=Simiduia curdlanivorans TaxID=1492769 RepID=A0ABV8VA04_9GAMM|nr:diguanylate cyclase [Simiduia curdlanivorans]MDN3639649.1 diguanylate cyclase [Simiduia curdlanivorans]